MNAEPFSPPFYFPTRLVYWYDKCVGCNARLIGKTTKSAHLSRQRARNISFSCIVQPFFFVLFSFPFSLLASCPRQSWFRQVKSIIRWTDSLFLVRCFGRDFATPQNEIPFSGPRGKKKKSHTEQHICSLSLFSKEIISIFQSVDISYYF